MWAGAGAAVGGRSLSPRLVRFCSTASMRLRIDPVMRLAVHVPICTGNRDLKQKP